MSNSNFHRDASQRLTFEMLHSSIESFPPICAELISAFELLPSRELVTNGWDIYFRDYRRGEQEIQLAWDNWSGFIVCAISPSAEPLVNEIGAWFLQSRWANNSMPD